MKNKALAWLVALVAAVGLSLVVAPPAQAVGWSGQRCDVSVDDVHTCIQVHTVASGTKYRIDTVQLCTSGGNNHFRKVFNNGITPPGTWRYGIPDTVKGSCSYAYPGYVSTNGCYTASGTIDLWGYPDDHWSVSGRVLGGAC